MIKAVVLDICGVTVRTDFQKSCAIIGARYGIDPDTFWAELRNKPWWHDFTLGIMAPEAFWQHLSGRLGVEVDGAFVVEQLVPAEGLDEEIVAFLQGLRRRVKLLAYSNGFADARSRYKALGLDKIYDVIFLSAEVGARKPMPGAFQHVVEQTGCAPAEILWVDDKQAYVDAAKAAGMQGLVITPEKNLKEELEQVLG
jgi:HAD superfamily hydrolase (TIGR01509 family)